MQITHQEARQLIQRRADQPLDESKREMLNMHLKGCTVCAEYANEIQETEATLRIALRKQWDVSPMPLEVMNIKVKITPNNKPTEYLATRSALVGMAVLVFFFVFWQFTYNPNGYQSPASIGVAVIPTPSLRLTSTQNNFDNCEMLQYEVRRNDTVESLARQFLVSENVIRELNNLKTDREILPSLLTIPACELTPTVTTYPPTSTTNTPALERITYTPG